MHGQQNIRTYYSLCSKNVYFQFHRSLLNVIIRHAVMDVKYFGHSQF